MKIIIIALALLSSSVSLAEPSSRLQTYRDASGRTLGYATTDARGNTVYRDSMARTTGRSVTSGGTTTIYDQMGRRVGNITKGR